MKTPLSLLISFLFLSNIYAQNSNAELTYHSTKITLKDGVLHKSISNVIKINNRAGEKFTKISIPFSALNKSTRIEAYIKDKNGKTVKKLKKKDIIIRSEISDFSFYEDNLVKEFTLKHNTFPYSIHYSYQEEQDNFLFVDYWLPVLDTQTPTLEALLEVNLPKEFKISSTERFIDNLEVDSTDPFLIKYTWKTSYTNLIKAERLTPPLINFFPAVIIVPEKFIFDIPGTLDSWKSFGNWQYELLQGLSNLPLKEKNKILSLIDGINDDREKIKILYNYLQNETRYINVTIETGGLKPYPASYVAENKYGDCKALSNYFKSVLDFVEIPSFYTKVYAGSPSKAINKELPSQQFNHIILCIPTETDTLWLDCTSDGPFNYLGTFTQNRDVFIIKNKESFFTRTPALSPYEVLETRKVKFSSENTNAIIADFENTYKGDNYESLFYVSRSFNSSQKERIVRNNFIEDGFDVIDFKLTKAHKDSAKIHLSYSAKTGKIYNTYGNETLIKLLPFKIPKFEDPKDRKLPVQLDYPIHKADTLEYSIPLGFKITNTLIDNEIKSSFGNYKIKYIQGENKITVHKSFLLNSGNYSKEEYGNFFNFLKKIEDLENSTYIVTSK